MLDSPVIRGIVCKGLPRRDRIVSGLPAIPPGYSPEASLGMTWHFCHPDVCPRRALFKLSSRGMPAEGSVQIVIQRHACGGLLRRDRADAGERIPRDPSRAALRRSSRDDTTDGQPFEATLGMAECPGDRSMHGKTMRLLFSIRRGCNPGLCGLKPLLGLEFRGRMGLRGAHKIFRHFRSG